MFSFSFGIKLSASMLILETVI